MKKQVSESLGALGFNGSEFGAFDNLDDQFKLLRRQYLKKCLETHPDKGGDAEVFRNVNESFEFLKNLVEKKLISTICVSCDTSAPQEYEFTSEHQGQMPSYQYYEQAAEEEMPLYRVELAKSSRGRCFAAKNSKVCGEHKEVVLIDQGTIRAGWLQEETGQYGRWCHLKCWRVPNKIWHGLPDPEKESDPQAFIDALLKLDGVILCGFAELKQEDQLEIVKHVSDQQNWATLRRPKPKEKAIPQVAQGLAQPALNDDTASTDLAASTDLTTRNQMVQKKEKFQIPVPGEGGALPNILQGQTVVLTGVFPEVGGGKELNLGKDKVKAMCESFGARVTTSVSDKTSLLLVGNEPGMSKVQQAAKRKVPTTDLRNIRQVIMGQVSLEKAPPAVITNFSAGYQSRKGLVLQYNEAYLEDLKQRSAAAKRPADQENTSSAKPKAAKKAKKAPAKKKAPPRAAGKENSNPSTANSNKKNRPSGPSEATKPAANAEANAYLKMTCVELRSALKERGLKQTGKKADLIARLRVQDAFRSQEQQPEVPVVPSQSAGFFSNPSQHLQYHLAMMHNQAMWQNSNPAPQPLQSFPNLANPNLNHPAVLQNPATNPAPNQAPFVLPNAYTGTTNVAAPPNGQFATMNGSTQGGGMYFGFPFYPYMGPLFPQQMQQQQGT